MSSSRRPWSPLPFTITLLAILAQFVASGPTPNRNKYHHPVVQAPQPPSPVVGGIPNTPQDVRYGTNQQLDGLGMPLQQPQPPVHQGPSKGHQSQNRGHHPKQNSQHQGQTSGQPHHQKQQQHHFKTSWNRHSPLNNQQTQWGQMPQNQQNNANMQNPSSQFQQFNQLQPQNNQFGGNANGGQYQTMQIPNTDGDNFNQYQGGGGRGPNPSFFQFTPFKGLGSFSFPLFPNFPPGYFTQTKPHPQTPPKASQMAEHDQLKFANEGLEAHNKYRHLHGVPPLVLDKQLSQDALKWAKKSANLSPHQPIQHSLEIDRGENIFFAKGYESVNGSHPVDEWYNEISSWNWGKPQLDVMKTGHFTAIVWKNTRKLGMAWAKGAADGQIIVVAQYQPPGNIRDEDFIRENVLPLNNKI